MAQNKDAKCCMCGREWKAWRANTFYCVSCVQKRPRLTGATAAIAAVARAVKRGELPPARALVCVDCGNPAHHYDHRDYSRPLDVQPVCAPCNWSRGPAKYLDSYRPLFVVESLAVKRAAKRKPKTPAAPEQAKAEA